MSFDAWRARASSQQGMFPGLMVTTISLQSNDTDSAQIWSRRLSALSSSCILKAEYNNYSNNGNINIGIETAKVSLPGDHLVPRERVCRDWSFPWLDVMLSLLVTCQHCPVQSVVRGVRLTNNETRVLAVTTNHNNGNLLITLAVILPRIFSGSVSTDRIRLTLRQRSAHNTREKWCRWDNRVLAREGLSGGLRHWPGWSQQCLLLQAWGGVLHEGAEASLLCGHAHRHDDRGPGVSLGSSGRHHPGARTLCLVLSLWRLAAGRRDSLPAEVLQLLWLQEERGRRPPPSGKTSGLLPDILWVLTVEKLQNSHEFGSSVSLKSSKSTVVTFEDDEVTFSLYYFAGYIKTRN